HPCPVLVARAVPGTPFASPGGVQARSTCLHCATPIPASMAGKDFCCNGCEAVYGLLHREGLGRYYELAGDRRAPVGEAAGPRSHSWLEPLLERSEETGGSICSLEIGRDTSELQSRENLVCRLLLEKKKK